MSARPLRFDWLLLIILALTLCMAAATVQVALGKIPPVFNQGLTAYRIINTGLILGLLSGAAVMVSHLVSGRFSGAVRCIKIAFVWLVTLEALLTVFDGTFISAAGSPIEAGFRNERVGGETLMLQQATELSPLGFKTPRKEPLAAPGKRILFLGNSYVRGSGTNFEANYPQAVESGLRRRLPDRSMSVMSAGVDGFGLHDDKLLYDYVVEKGYRIDAIVLNIMMQSDLTNNIPGTVRKAVAGEPQRFHENRFLRYFYPLNSTLFRYGVYFNAVFGRTWETSVDRKVQDATCTISPAFTAYIAERAAYYYGEGARERLYVDYNLAQAKEMIALAKTRHVPVFVVLLPDPAAALDSYRGLLKEQKMDWEWTRKEVVSQLSPLAPVYDLASLFRNKPQLFRCDDSHWLDEGNKAGADAVAGWLAGQLGHYSRSE